MTKFFFKYGENVNKTTDFGPLFPKLQTTRTLFKKRKSTKSLWIHILRWTGFLMIPLTALYNDFIGRRKLSEQQNPFEYTVPPPLKLVENQVTKNFLKLLIL